MVNPGTILIQMDQIRVLAAWSVGGLVYLSNNEVIINPFLPHSRLIVTYGVVKRITNCSIMEHRGRSGEQRRHGKNNLLALLDG